MNAGKNTTKRRDGQEARAERDRKVREKRKKSFLDELRNNGGRVKKACTDTGLSYSTLKYWKGNDPILAVDFDDAVEEGRMCLLDEAKRRAYEGTERPVYYRGEECGRQRHYSDHLLIMLLKGYFPEFRERHQPEEPSKDGEVPIGVNVFDMIREKAAKHANSTRNQN